MPASILVAHLSHLRPRALDGRGTFTGSFTWTSHSSTFSASQLATTMKLTFAFVALACVLFEVAAAMPALPRAQDRPLYIGDTADLEARGIDSPQFLVAHGADLPTTTDLEPVIGWATGTNGGLEKRGISYVHENDSSPVVANV
ncbi:uncharacterized protein B0H18DRAFT_1035066 [Fomitopsis serialis]|uniref:uncharacterized protein n=1 Tax=Fomitopsis serialis TaxID=139415 RepID=UPI002008C7B3|nr:uncharacterized protein B0H18DRAFT_1035066 [Neoantrodia serialis]KAH9917348.1 hypothetical protein B0H18DRAFT_1035066 [Neoantrodia serialis]